jgi:hypothetical protein
MRVNDKEIEQEPKELFVLLYYHFTQVLLVSNSNDGLTILCDERPIEERTRGGVASSLLPSVFIRTFL